MACETCGEKPKKCNCNKDFTRAVIEINNPEEMITLLRKVVIPATMGTEAQVPAAIGKYRNVVLYYEANKHTYIYSSDGIPTLIESEIPQELIDRIETLEEETQDLSEDLGDLQQEFEDFKNSPDVVDIVATYADLEAYDTSKLGDKDIIRVLADETHNGDSTYYRYSKDTDTFTYIGESKQYTDFVGTDGDTAGTSGLVPAPATTDAGKFLNADGSWENIPEVVQTTGTSTTDVMSQKAVTDAIEDSKGSVIILTEDDNNWNYNNHDTTDPDCVALWLLEPGIYVWGKAQTSISYSGLHILPAYTTLSAISDIQVGHLFGGCVVLPPEVANGPVQLFLFGRGHSANNVGMTGAVVIINNSTLGTGTSYYMLDSNSLVNNLTTNSTERPLSAYQGMVLGNRIMAVSTTVPGTTTVGVLGGLLPVWNGGTAELYMCTQEGAPGSGTGYAWTKIA